MKTIISFALLIFVLFFVGSCHQTAEDFINISGLQKSGDDWKLYAQKLDEEQGFIKLHQDKWLMYFLHWRPLHTKIRDLNHEYVRHHMLNFWGEAMNFQLTQEEGEMRINGHRALFVEGTLARGAIKTRFIVWNCPETHRQFTADCNINIRRGTPEKLLELQRQITETVKCHPASPQEPPNLLNKKYESSKWNLSFYLPENWYTSDFVYEEWFPNGMTSENGTLWTLLTDSEKHLELHWKATDSNLSAELFRQCLKEISADPVSSNNQPRIVNIHLDSLDKKSDYYIGIGSYQCQQYKRRKYQTFDYRFKGLLWRKGKKVYLLIAALIQLKEFWGMKIDLTPSEVVLEKFFKNEILPNLKVLNKAGLRAFDSCDIGK